jgi:peptidoglycan-N-acetylmuramic acid deacetylase
MKKIINIFIILLIGIFLTPLFSKQYSFGFKRSENELRVNPGIEIEDLLNKYNAKYIGNDDKSLYLTFDCGYELGYTDHMLDVLEEYSVNACFFVTGHFINKNKDLIERISNNDLFIIGNHTNKHKDMSKSNKDEIINDLLENEKIYTDMTNKKMSNFIRPPEGKFNELSLEVTNNLGYKNVFWSISHVDWLVDKQKGYEKSLNTLKNQLHNGGIILLHNVSYDNKIILEDLIKYAFDKGYKFKSLNELY